MLLFTSHHSFTAASRWVGDRSLVLMVVLSAVGIAACGENAPSDGPPAMPPTRVELAEVQPAAVEEAGEFVATLRSLRSTSIRPDVAGQIRRIHVSSGDRVEPGTPLVQIDPRRQEAAVSRQQAAIQAQRATVAQARQDRDRGESLVDAGLIARQDFDQLETVYATAQAQLESLEAELDEQRVNLQFYQVLAPTTGVVGDVPVRVGMYVTPEVELTRIDGEGLLEVYVQVPVEHGADLQVGLPLTVLDGRRNELAKTTVSYVSSSVNDQTQSILVKGRLSDGASLRSEQYVRARIVWRTSDEITVPVLAVTRTGSQHFVFVAKPQDEGLVAEQRPIEVGEIVGDELTVRSGLAPDEQIVVSGVQMLFDGMPIAARE